jgi:hypothetical protein
LLATCQVHIFSPTVYNDFRLAFVPKNNYTESGGLPVPQRTWTFNEALQIKKGGETV